MVEGMLYRIRVGCPWRDLPKAFGRWNSIYKKFNAWSACSKWLAVFKTLVIDPDVEWIFIDGSYAKAHQHSAGAASNDDEGIGKSRAGNTTKIHLAVDGYGLQSILILPAEPRMTARLRRNSLQSYLRRELLLLMKAMTAKQYESKLPQKEAVLSSRENATPSRVTMILTEHYIDTAIWSRMLLPG